MKLTHLQQDREGADEQHLTQKGDITVNIKYYEQLRDHTSRNMDKMDKSKGGQQQQKNLASIDIRRNRKSRWSYNYYMH